jgi:uncharacterized protein (DUF488 family)
LNEERPEKSADWPRGAIFTIGHSRLPIDRFLGLLRTYGIESLADIRSIPRSRHNPQFNADALADTLTTSGIDYLSMPALGGLRHARKDSPNTGWRNESFRGFADYMQTPAFAEALDKLIAASREKRVAIMCAEAVPWRCHRSLVADALMIRGVPAIEILSNADSRPHELTPFAHVDGTRLTYPPLQQSLV